MCLSFVSRNMEEKTTKRVCEDQGRNSDTAPSTCLLGGGNPGSAVYLHRSWRSAVSSVDLWPPKTW